MDKRVSKSFSFEGQRYYVKAKTEAEAKKKIEEKLEILKGEKILESRRTLDSWWNEYMEVYKPNISDYTREVYDMIYRNAIAPHLGKMALKDIKQINCRKFLNSLDGKSRSYIHKAHFLLNSCFNAAVDNDLISKNPMKGLIMPEGTQGRRRALTEDERKWFLLATEKCGDAGYYGKLIYYCGLRPSEAMRVCAEDFDRKERMLKNFRQ